jgi:hypothetical protein
VFIRLLDQPGPNSLVNVELGAYAGFLLCAAVTAGCGAALRDEGTTAAAARAQAEALLAARGRTMPRPPTRGEPPPPLVPPGGAG